MKYFLPVVLACSSLLTTRLFVPEKPPPLIVNAQAQAERAVPDSPAGLQSQLEEILNIKDEKELKRREQLVSELRIPDPDAWFASALGNDDGGKLAATYKSSWEKFGGSVANSMTNLAEEERTEVSVKEFRFRAKPAVQGQNESPQEWSLPMLAGGWRTLACEHAAIWHVAPGAPFSHSPEQFSRKWELFLSWRHSK